MADQQAGANGTPAAETPDPDRSAADPTRDQTAPTRAIDEPKTDNPGTAAARGEHHSDEPSTERAPVRWSGSAAVPPPQPKRSRWARRRTTAARGGSTPNRTPPNPTAPNPTAPDPTAVDPEDWAATPAVDPWAGQDTLWDLGPPIPESLPPTRLDPALLPPNLTRPLTSPAPGPLAAAPVEPRRRRGWGRKRPKPAAQTPNPVPTPTSISRLPVQPRPAAAPPLGQRPFPPLPAQPAMDWGARGRAIQSRTSPPLPGLPPAARRQPATQPPTTRPADRRSAGAGPAGGRSAGTGPADRRSAGEGTSRGRPLGGPKGQRPLSPPTRRRRRWPRRLALFTLFSVACCGGVPAYFSWPAARQYPVTAALPQSVSDLSLRDDRASRRAVDKLTQQLRDSGSASDVFAGVYTDDNGKRVTLFGTTGLRLSPKSDVEAEVQHLTNEYDVRDVEPFDLGETGAHERCGVGDASGTSVVVCAWADHGSLGAALLTRRSVADSAALLATLRSAVLTHG